MHFLGLEIGHGGTRAVVLDIEAAVIRAEAWVPHDWIEGLPAGYREQNPAQWIDAVDRAARECLESLGDQRERIAAVGVGGPQRGLVLLDESNRIIRPAKLAGDISVKRQAEELARAWEGPFAGGRAQREEYRAYRESVGKLMGVIGQFRHAATDAQRLAAAERLDEARKALYLILAE